MVPERSCIRIPDDVPFEVGALLGCAVTSGVGAVWHTASVRPGDRVAVVGLGGTGLAAVMGAVAVGAAQVIAVDAREHRLERALELGATAAVLARVTTPTQTAAELVRASGGGVDYAFETTARSAAIRAAFLSTRPRGATVLLGIPRADAELVLPALSIPRMERRILGSIYGSARPDRDIPMMLEALSRRSAPARQADLASPPARTGGRRRGPGSLGPSDPRSTPTGLNKWCQAPFIHAMVLLQFWLRW